MAGTATWLFSGARPNTEALSSYGRATRPVLTCRWAWVPQPTEVEEVLELSLPDLVNGYELKRLIRRGVPIKTPTYTVGGHLVWGATGRIVQMLLERLKPIL